MSPVFAKTNSPEISEKGKKIRREREKVSKLVKFPEQNQTHIKNLKLK
jgi:hypothetical protein